MKRVSEPFWIRAVLLGLAALGLPAVPSRADRIVLRGGGQVRGKVLTDTSQPGRVSVLTGTGKTPLVFDKPRIVEVVPEPSPLDDYVVKRAQAARSATAQHELGLWCAEHKLPDLAEVHYEAAVQQDKTFAPSHQKLGHVLYGDRWLDRDEMRAVQGLVRYKGKWITKDEKEQREARAALSAEQSSWLRRIKQLRQAIANGPEERRREAESQLLEIREPIAVRPLVGVLGEDADPFRSMLDRILGEIPGQEAAAALVTHVLFEPEPEVRQVTLEQLERRKESEIVPMLLKALRATEPVIVNRAAWVLANLNVVTAVPKLIPALFTTQYKVVWASSTSSGGGINVGFNSAATPEAGPVPLAYNGSSIAYLTPPSVGPGSVAYGVTTYNPATVGVSVGGGVNASRGSVPRLVPYTYQNVEVHAALTKLTGVDLGFDVGSWKSWLKTSFKPDPVPARRVPQP